MSNNETKPYRVVVWGDSIACGSEEFNWPVRAEHIHNAVVNLGRPIQMINESVCGKPAAAARHEFEERILKHSPDLVIIQFGFNDLRHDGSRGKLPLSTPEEFCEHLIEMIDRCQQEAKAKVIVFGNHQPQVHMRMPSGRTYDATRALYNKTARTAAATCNATFFDMSEELPTPTRPAPMLVCEDGVHLSPIGYHTYARFAAECIMEILSQE